MNTGFWPLVTGGWSLVTCSLLLISGSARSKKRVARGSTSKIRRIEVEILCMTCNFIISHLFELLDFLETNIPTNQATTTR